MKSKFLKSVIWLYQLLGLSLWKFPTTATAGGNISFSKLALILSVLNFCAVILSRLFISYELDQRISLSQFHNSYLVELGDDLLKRMFLVRYYIIYISVWFFYRKQKTLIQLYLDVTNGLKKIQNMCKQVCKCGSEKKVCDYKKQQRTGAVIRLILVPIIAWNVPVNMIIQAFRGCNFYDDSLRDYRVMIATLLMICGSWGSLIGILSSLLIVETKFDQIRFWLKTVRDNSRVSNIYEQRNSK